MSDGNQPRSNLKVVGQRPVRPDGVDKVTGRAQFGADFHLPGMLTARIKRSPHAHARIVKIDASAAEKLPGVKAVVTGADFDAGAGGEVEAGEAPRRGKGSRRQLPRKRPRRSIRATPSPLSPPPRPEIAAEALDLIEVTYEVLPHVIDVEEALPAATRPCSTTTCFTKGVNAEARPSPPTSRQKRVMGRGDAASRLRRR